MNYLIVFAEDSPESKIANDLLPFFEAMIKEVARHVPDKGYTFKDPKYRRVMAELASERAYDYMIDVQGAIVSQKTAANPGEALDSAAFIAFSWLHETGQIHGLRRDE